MHVLDSGKCADYLSNVLGRALMEFMAKKYLSILLMSVLRSPCFASRSKEFGISSPVAFLGDTSLAMKTVREPNTLIYCAGQYKTLGLTQRFNCLIKVEISYFLYDLFVDKPVHTKYFYLTKQE